MIELYQKLICECTYSEIENRSRRSEWDGVFSGQSYISCYSFQFFDWARRDWRIFLRQWWKHWSIYVEILDDVEEILKTMKIAEENLDNIINDDYQDSNSNLENNVAFKGFESF